MNRRELLRLAAIGGLGAAGGFLLGRRGSSPIAGHPNAHAGPVPDSLYSHGVEPPAGLGPTALDGLLRPPPFIRSAPRRREFSLAVEELPVEVARGQTFMGWTYNGTIPGPVLRATEGDELAVRFRNLGAHPHNVHFHGTHDVSQDGWEPLPPGGQTTYSFRAAPFGLHPYHCHALPVSTHMARGLYGALIVDPPGGRPPAHELVLVFSGFDLDGDGRDELYAWNGVAGFFARFPIKVPAGALVRVYLLNLCVNDPFVSFHLHAETFDIFRSGTSLKAEERGDTITLAPSERAILEFRLPSRGRYMFQPHQQQMAEHGGMGWMAAV